jgi:hypothetical protein
VLPIRPPALLAGPSGSGKSSALEAYEALARLCGGADLTDVFGTAGGERRPACRSRPNAGCGSRATGW